MKRARKLKTACGEKEISHVVVGSGIFIVAIIAAIFGFTGIAAGAVEIAQFLFWLFVILFVVSLVVGMVKRPRA